MPVLELTREEAQLLQSALRTYEDTLVLEIANTDSRAFKEGLKRREAIVRGVLARIRSEVPEPSQR